jgi:hypothetical protein
MNDITISSTPYGIAVEGTIITNKGEEVEVSSAWCEHWYGSVEEALNELLAIVKED